MNTEPTRLTFAQVRAMNEAGREAHPATRRTVTPGSQSPVTMGSKVEPEPEIEVTMTNPGSDWAQRLAREWGLGERPDLRRRFFAKVAELLEQHGDRCLRLVSAARMQAHGKQHPATYFCKSLALKICEAGLLPGGEVLRAW